MIRSKLDELTIADLVQRFADIGIEQDKALLWGEIGKFNKLFDRKTAIEAELKSRVGDQRHALLGLFDHPNLQVRLNAAKATLAAAPEAARGMLERIKEWRRQPQAGDAGMCLLNLDRGIFMPD